MSSRQMGSAELAFSQAFDRLKSNTPVRLKPGTPVSQNNVAKEAGRDPSALRKSRYPTLINEIQRWCRENSSEKPASTKIKQSENRARGRELQKLVLDLKLQRDVLASLLLEADAKILALLNENSELRKSIPSTNIYQFEKDVDEKKKI